MLLGLVLPVGADTCMPSPVAGCAIRPMRCLMSGACLPGRMPGALNHSLSHLVSFCVLHDNPYQR